MSTGPGRPRGTTDLSSRTWSEVAAGRPQVLAVPVGSLEQHGPHLPLDTDTLIATEVARRLASQRGDVVVSPPIAIGASGEHAGFAGTLSIGSSVLEEVLVEVARSADHFVGVVFVNGHGGNVAGLERAVERLRGEGRRALAVSCGVPGGDAHAGRSETSLVLALRPDAVRVDRVVVGNTEPWPALRDRVLEGGVMAVSPNGVLGDPTGASAAEGRSLFDAIVSRVVESVAGWPHA